MKKSILFYTAGIISANLFISNSMARTVFLPDGYKDIQGDYGQHDPCSKKENLFTKQNCTYPKTVDIASRCAFRPNYYTTCKCLPQFKLSSCPDPKIPTQPTCDGKFENCICPPKVQLTLPNDKCTKYCENNCIQKECIADKDEQNCHYGIEYVTNGCDGTRIKCKPAQCKFNFFYSDGTDSSSLDKNKTAIGIIVNNMIVSIFDFEGDKSYNNGAYATYTKYDIPNWNAPTMSQIKTIYTNKQEINKCMQILNAPQLYETWYWTKDNKGYIYINEFHMTTQETNKDDSSARLRIRLVK